jgi:hypothetical protein
MTEIGHFLFYIVIGAIVLIALFVVGCAIGTVISSPDDGERDRYFDEED